MTPTISATADNGFNNNNNSPNAFHETQFQQHSSPFSQDENNFPLQESAWPSAFREATPSSTSSRPTSSRNNNKEPLSSNQQQQVFQPPHSSSIARLSKDNNKEPLISSNQQQQQQQQQVISADAWKVGSKSKLFDSSHTTTMREPAAVPNAIDYSSSRHALRVVDGQSNAFESPRSTRQEFLEESESAMVVTRNRQATMDDARKNERIPMNRAQSPTTRRHPSPIPRNPASPSPLLRSKQHPTHHQTTRVGDSQSVHSQASKVTSGSIPMGTDFHWEQNNDPDDQEQALFEQRLCDDIYGVAVRKINQNGKSNLRYVKCSTVDAAELEIDSSGFSSSSRSVSSRSRGFPRFRDRSVDSRSESRGFPRFRDRSLDRSENRDSEAHRTLMKGKKVRVLAWGKKKDVKIPLERFVAVRKGKTTDRTRRNVCPASRILSLITDDPHNQSLDIEAPTRLDRDKFARAFSRFLSVPLEGDDVRSVRSELTNQSKDRKAVGSQQPISSMKQPSVASTPDANSIPFATNSQATGGSRGSRKKVPLPTDNAGSQQKQSGLPPKSRPPPSSDPFDAPDPQIASVPSSANVSATDAPLLMNVPFPKNNSAAPSTGTTERSQVATPGVQVHHNDEGSVVSSITGGGFDQEIVEELHVALTELRSELEESRAEAARAVKVAEQAIQSAEHSSSKDWNSTVTHKAAEAAALAQKKSAEAMAKARMAEERLEGERKAAHIWKKQAAAAEEEAGHWQTRAAAAEVQRAAMVEALENERKKAAALRSTAAQKIPTSEDGKRDVLEATMERNRALEFELEVMRQSLNKKMGEVASLQDCLAEIETAPEALKATINNGASKALQSGNALPSSADFDNISAFEQSGDDNEFGIVNTSGQLGSLPDSAKLWAEQASQALLNSHAEVQRLRLKVASESSARRRLLHEVQDLRGTIRVYIRPRPLLKGTPIISFPSQDVLLLHRERSSFRQDGPATPLSFDFDGILSPEMEQQDIYDELEDVCLSAMDGYNVCVMTYGQSGTGKTLSLLGDVKYEGKEQFVSISNLGVHLRAAKQMFSVLKHRRERYSDVVSISVVEVCDERLCDLLAGTLIGETSGRPEISRKSNRKRNDSNDGTSSQNSKPTRLEIKTNHNGETIVHGLLAVEVSCFEDVLQVWKECLSRRATRLCEQGLDMSEHESKSHLIGTIRVHSTNITTGVATQGKIQFVDLASSNVLPRRQSSVSKKSSSTPESILSGVGNNQEWKFTHRSISTLNEVVQARNQYQRSVPYRNSTITHLLRDSLESDTKVVVLGCISSELKDLQETACTLKFAQKLRNVVIGKATRHTV